VIAGYRHGVHEICNLLGFYAALVCSNQHFGHPIGPIVKTFEDSHLEDADVQEFLNICAHQLTGDELQQLTALMKRILTTDKRWWR
jgi:hypothetical protein